MGTRSAASLWAHTFLLLGACSGGAEPPTGPGVEIAVAPLSYPGIADVCYRLEVFNGPPGLLGTDTVWSKAHVCSTTYGNLSGGDISYVGPCDADVDVDNRVELVLETVTVAGGATLDDQVSTTDGDADFVNPCPLGDPCTLEFECEENADVLVQFNLTVLRDAEQGFFDIAVNFEDIFCSAKLDCQYDDGPITLLHRPDGSRGQTAVLAFACTSGPGATADTVLHMNSIAITCGGDTVTLDPTVGPGNAYNLANPDPDLSDAVWQYATYLGVESLPCGLVSCNKLYWNVAIGFEPSFRDCAIVASATASTSSQMTNALTPPATTYPWIAFEGALTADADGGGLVCDQNPLNELGSGVVTHYTPVSTPKPFCHRYDGVDVATSTAAACRCVPATCDDLGADICDPEPVDDGCGGTLWCHPADQSPRAVARTELSAQIRLDPLGNKQVVIPATAVDAGSYDLQTPPGAMTFAIQRDSGGPVGPTITYTCDDVGQRFITFYVTDAQGLVAQVQTSVYIADDLALCDGEMSAASNVTAICQPLSANLGMVGGVPTAIIAASTFDAGSYSDDPSATLTFTVKESFIAPREASLVVDDCNLLGEQMLNLYASDGAGNEASCETHVLVQDPSCLCFECGGTASPSAPQAIARNGIAVELHMASSTTCPEALCADRVWVEVSATAVNQGSVDALTPAADLVLKVNSNGAGPPSDVVRFDCSDLGQMPVTLFVTDSDGETSIAETYVIVQDNSGYCSVCDN